MSEESAYRRGVQQALSFAADRARASGASLVSDDLNDLADAAGRLRARSTDGFSIEKLDDEVRRFQEERRTESEDAK